MNPNLKNVLAVILGIVVGSIVNMGIIMLSSSIIPLPEGVDPANVDSLKESMHLFEPKHFIFPFLAHALGTFSGAWVAGVMAARNKFTFAFAIGVFFLIGGIINVSMLPAPLWFNMTDLLVAYLPMSWLAGKIVTK